MKRLVLGCIDGSAYSSAVCDAAAWAAVRMEVPLSFLHVLNRVRAAKDDDLSGSIGFGAQESLLEELAALDETRGKLAMERGRQMLAAARERVCAAGVPDAEGRQRHGELVETLMELEEGVRLFVLGKRGESAAIAAEHLGSHLERVIRSLHRPILMTTAQFQAPQRVMLAFDGSATTRKGVDMVAASPLFRGLPCHLVMIGSETEDSRAQLAEAQRTLHNAGFEAPAVILPGDVEDALRKYQQDNGIDLIIMGAYGHSRIRHLLIGSTTAEMMRNSSVPLLLLR